MTLGLKTAAAVLAATMLALPAGAVGEESPAAEIVAGPAQAGPMYAGRPVSLDYQRADIRRILALFAEFSGKNVVVPDSVKGRVTVKLDNVPWDQALDLILASQNLGVLVAGNVLMIDDLPKLQARGVASSNRARADGGQVLVGRIFTPKYAPADLVASELAKLKSERGRVMVVGNEIFVEDYPSVIGKQTRLLLMP